MTTVSVVVNTYNAEKYMERCMQSAKDADEIIVCDMHSTDKTVEIAQKHGAKVVYFENVGFAEPARNFANSQVTSDYFIVLDSDEYLSEDFIKNIKKFIDEQEIKPYGIEFTYKNEILGKVLHSYSKSKLLRFFKKGCVNYPARVHAGPEVSGEPIIIFPNVNENSYVTHTMVDDIKEHADKWNLYSSLELEKFKKRGTKFSIKTLLTRPFLEFIKVYFLKQGFRDGIHGYIFAIIAANYKFMTIAKLWEAELK